MKIFCCHKNPIFATIVHLYIDECSWKTQMKIFVATRMLYLPRLFRYIEMTTVKTKKKNLHILAMEGLKNTNLHSWNFSWH
jgi:hypothetical protein